MVSGTRGENPLSVVDLGDGAILFDSRVLPARTDWLAQVPSSGFATPIVARTSFDFRTAFTCAFCRGVSLRSSPMYWPWSLRAARRVGARVRCRASSYQHGFAFRPSLGATMEMCSSLSEK